MTVKQLKQKPVVSNEKPIKTLFSRIQDLLKSDPPFVIKEFNKLREEMNTDDPTGAPENERIGYIKGHHLDLLADAWKNRVRYIAFSKMADKFRNRYRTAIAKTWEAFEDEFGIEPEDSCHIDIYRLGVYRGSSIQEMNDQIQQILEADTEEELGEAFKESFLNTDIAFQNSEEMVDCLSDLINATNDAEDVKWLRELLDDSETMTPSIRTYITRKLNYFEQIKNGESNNEPAIEKEKASQA